MWLGKLTSNSLQLSNPDYRAKCGDFYPRMTGELFEGLSSAMTSGCAFSAFSRAMGRRTAGQLLSRVAFCPESTRILSSHSLTEDQFSYGNSYHSSESLLKSFIPKKRKSVTGEIVLITGAGHGIGRLTAYEFAKLKSKLVLWDINKHGLEETAAECRKLGAQAHAFVVDCSNREDIYSSAKKVKTEVGDVSILVNNAGVVYTSDLFATQDPQIEKTFEVNVLAHFWTTKAFLPAMMRNNHGHIVTVASAAGHTTVPFLMAYCSSKFAAVGFHRALTEELVALGRTGVKTSCLCPNFINTGFIKNPSTSLGPTLEPEEVVSKLMKGVLTNQKMIFVPSSISAMTVVERIFPERFLAVLKRKINVRFDAVIGYKSKGE